MTSQTPNFERNEMETKDREMKSSANRGYIVNSMEGSQILARNGVAFEVGSPRCGQAGSYMQIVISHPNIPNIPNFGISPARSEQLFTAKT